MDNTEMTLEERIQAYLDEKRRQNGEVK